MRVYLPIVRDVIAFFLLAISLTTVVSVSLLGEKVQQPSIHQSVNPPVTRHEKTGF